MKKIYIIQDANNPLNIIAFDTRKSMRTYAYKFNFQLKKDIGGNESDNCFGIISDCKEVDGYTTREIYIKEIETARY